MKIVIISQVVTPGLLIFRKSLIEELVSRGHEVYCFAADYSESSRNKILELGATPVDYSLSRAGLNPFRDFFDLIKLSRELKEINPDLVFASFVKPVIYGGLAAKWAGVPNRIGMLEGLGYVFTEQLYAPPIKVKLIRFAQVLLYKLSIPTLSKIIFLNPDDPIDLIDNYKIKAKKVEVLGGIGLDLNDFPYVEPKLDRLRFIFIGRLLAEKGIHEYLAAAKKVKEKYPLVEFVVLGGLDEENPGGLKQKELEHLIAENIIIYPGYVENTSKWIADSGVFVLPSYREGLPRSTQEAMAVGRAVITTDRPGCRETVIDGENGYLVPPWNPKALYEAMCKFVENPQLIKTMGVRSHQMAKERFDVRVVNQKLMKLLDINEAGQKMCKY